MEWTPQRPFQDYNTAYWTANNYWDTYETETAIFDDLEQLERERDRTEIMPRGRPRSTISTNSAATSFYKFTDGQFHETVSNYRIL